jgi:hypothetical protein
MRKPGVRRRINQATHRNQQMTSVTAAGAAAVGTGTGGINGTSITSFTDSEAETLNACLQDCMDYLVKTDLWQMLVVTLDQALSPDCGTKTNTNTCRSDTRRIRQIVVYGIGNFSETGKTYYSASMWQLAFAVCLRTHFTDDVNHSDGNVDKEEAVIRLVYFDPCSTADEKTFLVERLDFHLLTTNDRGNHPVSALSTLFFMPHCPAQLYEHVVWSNFWDHRDASSSSSSSGQQQQEPHIILIGNSLRNLAENGKRRLLPCLQALLPFLHETELQPSVADNTQAPGNLVGAFNDTYVSYYSPTNVSHDWPKRPYDALLHDVNNADPELL